MPSVYHMLYGWARRTNSFAQLRVESPGRDGAGHKSAGLIYRLKHWPELPSPARTAGVLRALSVMSSRPVNREWILAHSKLRAQDVDRLLARLIAQGAVEVIDAAQYTARPTPQGERSDAGASCASASTLSMRLPSRSTTSKSQSPQSIRSPAAGRWPDTDISRPATVL